MIDINNSMSIHKKKKIIFSHLNDPSHIIFDLMWIKCVRCNQHKEDEQGIYLYSEDFICLKCINKEKYYVCICSNCNLNFIKDFNFFCKMCRSHCIIYCNDCLGVDKIIF